MISLLFSILISEPQSTQDRLFNYRLSTDVTATPSQKQLALCNNLEAE